MKPAARIEATIEILDSILENLKKPADQIVTAYFRGRRYIGSSDRREISTRVYDILRQYISLSWIISQACEEVTARLLVLTQDPSLTSLFTGEHHEPALLSFSEKKFLSAPKKEVLPQWAQLNIPEWIQPYLEKAYPDWAELAACFATPAPFDLRVNLLKVTRDKVMAALKSDGIKAEVTSLSPWGIRLLDRRPLSASPLYQKGWVDVQDEGSQLIALLADVHPSQSVLDYCAGAGGKTLALAAVMQNKGTLLALDTATWRLDRAGERLRRAGATSVQRRSLDDDATRQWLRRQAGRFDRVLVDAPCSGTGTWRRNPDARLKFCEQDLRELVSLQRKILGETTNLVKIGGRLIYATCSVLPEENQDQVSTFLAENPGFKLVPANDIWSSLLSAPYPSEGEMLQLTPNRHQTDGFFVAIMERLA